MIALKALFLFMAVLFSVSVFGKIWLRREDIPVWIMALQAVGISGFITCQWLI